MDLAGDELLARARLARDEDGRFRRRGALDLLSQLAHSGRFANELVLALFFLAQLADLLLESLRPDGIPHRQQELVAIQRLLEEIKCAALRAFDGGGDVGVAADHDHRRRDFLFLQILEDLDAVEDGHLDVEQDGVVRRLLRLVQPLLPRPRLIDAIPLVLQRHPDRLPDARLIVNHQNSIRHTSNDLSA